MEVQVERSHKRGGVVPAEEVQIRNGAQQRAITPRKQREQDPVSAPAGKIIHLLSELIEKRVGFVFIVAVIEDGFDQKLRIAHRAAGA